MTEYTHFVNLYFFQILNALFFEFFRFLNWRKALKSFLYMNITCKAVKYITSVQDTLSLISLCVQEGITPAFHQLIVLFPVSKEHTQKDLRFDSEYKLLSPAQFGMCLCVFKGRDAKENRFDLSSSVLQPPDSSRAGSCTGPSAVPLCSTLDALTRHRAAMPLGSTLKGF